MEFKFIRGDKKKSIDEIVAIQSKMNACSYESYSDNGNMPNRIYHLTLS